MKKTYSHTCITSIQLEKQRLVNTNPYKSITHTIDLAVYDDGEIVSFINAKHYFISFHNPDRTTSIYSNDLPKGKTCLRIQGGLRYALLIIEAYRNAGYTVRVKNDILRKKR